MKPSIKLGSFLLAVMMAVTAVVAVGCTPTSLKKEWAYKTADNELAIGVYIYSLDLAYSQAQKYASEQLDDYTTAKSDWLDEKITPEDEEEVVAREWIKSEAKRMCYAYLAVDAQLKELGSTPDMAAADSQAEEYWNLGQYASYGYVMPMSDDLEPYGISFDSFKYCTTEFSTKQSELFTLVYGEGGSQEVSDKELGEYFHSNYVDYSYFTVNLYESTTDEAGGNSDVALSDEKIKELTDEFDGYAESLNNGTSYDDLMAEYMEKKGLDSDPSTSGVDNYETTSLGDELVDALKKLGDNKATTLKVGDGNSAVYYVLYKRDITGDDADYVAANSTYRSSVLTAMKTKDFDDYIDSLADNMDIEENTSVLGKYKPELFFVAKEETTSASNKESKEEE